MPNPKLIQLLEMVHNVRLFQAGPGHDYWIEFTDEYEKRTLCDSDFNSLIDRAHSIASVSKRSAEREKSLTAAG